MDNQDIQQLRDQVFQAVALHVIQNNEILLVPELKRQRRDLEINQTLTDIEATKFAMPGKGYMVDGKERRDSGLPQFRNDLIDRLLSRADDCQKQIFFLPSEFNFILPIFTARSVDLGLYGGKGGFRGRLFELLSYMKSIDRYKQSENLFDHSASAIWKNIGKDAETLLTIFKDILDDLFPTEEERDFLKTCVPDVLLGQNIFGSVDSSKVVSFDSIDSATNKTHFNLHKGFGLSLLIWCDTLGNIFAIKSDIDGNQHDMEAYRSSDFFLQKPQYVICDSDCLLGDSYLIGNVVNRQSSAQFPKPFSPAEIAEADGNGEDGNVLREFNRARQSVKATVENNNAGIKCSSHAGDQRKIRSSLIETSTGKYRTILFNDLAVYMHVIAMRMRGQTHASNSQLFNCGLDGPDQVRVSLARTTHWNMILGSRSTLNYGTFLSGTDALNLQPFLQDNIAH